MNPLDESMNLKLDQSYIEQKDPAEAYNQMETKGIQGPRNNYIKLINDDEIQRMDSGCKMNLGLQSKFNIKNSTSMNSNLARSQRKGHQSKSKIGVSDFKDDKLRLTQVKFGNHQLANDTNLILGHQLVPLSTDPDIVDPASDYFICNA